MFNIPWYSWFNVLAIPLLWGLMWVGLRIEKAPRWEYHASLVGHLCLVAIIVLYWNPQAAALLHPSIYLIALLALGTALTALLPTLYECLKINVRTVRLLRHSPNSIKATESRPAAGVAPAGMASEAAASKAEPVYVNGIMDIDDDPCCDADTLQIVDAFSAALSPQKSILDSDLVQNSSKEFSDEDLQGDPTYWNASMWITFVGFSIVLGAPVWMSLQFLKTLPAYFGWL